MKFDKKRAAKVGKGVAKHGSRAVGSLFGLAVKTLVTMLLIFVTTGVMIACVFASYVNNELSEGLELNLSNFALNQSSVIYYMDKDTQTWEELVTLYSDENRIWASGEEIPEHMKHAAVAIEDKRFYEHNGVDWYRTVAAFGNMFLGFRDTFGASTLTQQLIKNLTERNEVTVARKFMEIFSAIEFERTYDKETILEWYLNTIYLGEQCYGVSTAAYTYFGKELKDLSITESAAIISITNNPSIYDPYIDPEANQKRREIILAEMYKEGYIETEEEYDACLRESATLKFSKGEEEESANSHYTYFEDLVINDVIDSFVTNMGVSREWAEKMVFCGGYKIYCTLDTELQAIVDEVYTNLENIPATTGSAQQLQSGITLIDNETGCVVAVCGGVGEKTTSRGWSYATDTLRPPGSSIKPLAVYSPALELGMISPLSVIDDAPLATEISGVEGDWPRNDDYEYDGLMTVRDALRRSRNAVAARIMVMLTPQASYDFLVNRYHLTSLVVSRDSGYGTVLTDISYAPLALGELTDGASTREMAQAYATFPNDGVYTESRTFLYITDADDNMVFENSEISMQAISEKTAYYINSMLTNAVQAGTGTEARLSGMTVAGKTGTTGSNNDRWFVGYTPYYTAAVWTGYDMPETIRMVNGGNPAAQLWNKVMSRVHEGLEYREFTGRTDLVSVTVCAQCGLLPSDYTRETSSGYVCSEDAPHSYCMGEHWSDAVPENWEEDPLTGLWVDTITGWNIDDVHALLIHPVTGELFTQEEAEAYLEAQLEPSWEYDEGVGLYRDRITGWYADLREMKLINPDTGELLDQASAVDYVVTRENPTWSGSYAEGYYDTVTGWDVDLDSMMLMNPHTGELCTQEEAEEYLRVNPEEEDEGFFDWFEELFG